LLLDGVFHQTEDGSLAFIPLPPPTSDEVARLVATVRRRILRMLNRRGALDEDGVPADAQSSSSALGELAGAAVRNTRALGPHAGTPILRLGRDPNAPWVCSRAPLHAHIDGFDLHAAIDGTVHAAYDRLARRRLAIKTVRSDVAELPEVRQRFLNEARVLMGIANPHVVSIVALGELVDGRLYYAMELVDGVPLDACGPLNIDETIEVGLQLCDGLGAAHAHGIVHRDIKPANVMVTTRPDGALHCKLIDFGIAKTASCGLTLPLPASPSRKPPLSSLARSGVQPMTREREDESRREQNFVGCRR
jgi:hypothetical protein